MANKKKSKIQTPDWILKGEKPPKEKKKGKTFKIRRCPKCNSDEVMVVVGEESKGMWECKKCGWKGKDVKEEELDEDKFLEYLYEKGDI
jgi:Zn ribbon nucleic-acid-binding protein